MLDRIFSLLGSEYELGGRGPDKFDCWGLCIEVYKILGVELPDEPVGYTISEAQKLMIPHITEFKRVEYEEFCLVKFKPRPNWHVGVMIDKDNFIHISHGRTASVSRIKDVPWKVWFSGFYRYE